MFFTAPYRSLITVFGACVLGLTFAGCAARPDGKLPVSVWQCPDGQVNSEMRTPPADDARRVSATNALPVRGLNGWEGEISGRPLPGSKFDGLLIGMRPSEVAARIGAPSDYGSYMTQRESGQLRYFGGDLSRYEMVYAGSGRLIFSTRSGFGPGRYLTWIVHSLQ
ncbi:MAG: hypothetical protein ABJB17_07870 [Burkholderiales bacterium]